jgi:hypothetical protein
VPWCWSAWAHMALANDFLNPRRGWRASTA